MNIFEFIAEEGLVMIIVLWIIGYFFKNSKILKNEWIPFLLLLTSLFLTPLKLGGYTAENIIQAILVTGAAVLGHQFVINGERLIK
ncbi:phage holin family protein [Enterococcus sp. DIV0840c]|uniref:phage holin family protein n=1 Tax=Enterococcus sp. DIV0840c TaxID=2774772 RepID=UPI003D28F486